MTTSNLSAEQLHTQALDRHRAADLAGASQLYAQALAADADYAPALHMSGTLAFQQGDLVTAQRNMARAFALGYTPVMLWWHYGCVLLAAQKASEAVKAFQAALKLQPGDGELLMNLGTAAHQAGQGDVALSALNEAAQKLNNAAAYYALGRAAQQFGQKIIARNAYAEVLLREPTHADAALNAGVLAHENGDLPAAIRLYRQALVAQPAMIQASVNLAAALQDMGDLNAAEQLLQKVLAADPKNIDALNNYGSIQQRRGDDAGAEQTYRKVLAINPLHEAAIDNLASSLRRQGKTDQVLHYPVQLAQQFPQQAQAWLVLARAYEREGQYAEQLAALQKALDLDGQSAAVHDMTGTAYQLLNDLPAALEHYWHAVERAPQETEYQINLGLAALRLLDVDTALPILDKLLATNRFDQRAIAYRALALRVKGDAAAADAWTDPQKLAAIMEIKTPEGYGNLAQFLDVLVKDLRAVKNRSWSPYGQSVRGGSQTENMLFAETSPSIQAFRAMLDTTINEYLNNRTLDDSHPFWAARPSRLQYRSWSVILKKGGYHIPHIHPGGAISGVFYVAVPPLSGEEGWLELGPSGIDVALPSPPPSLRVEPIPGRLVLFPSYMWHGTLPFMGEGERITIAFDVVQVDA